MLASLVLLFRKLLLDEERKNHQLYQDEGKSTLTNYLNAEMSLHTAVAGGNCKICFPIICIFLVILDQAEGESVYPIFVDYS